MKAVVYKRFGEPDVLEYIDHQLPERAPGQVTVRIKATSVNPVDWKIRQGKLPFAKKPKILGGDFSGVVEASDADSQYKPGGRVFGLSPDWSQTSKWGTYAEVATVKASLITAIPDGVSFDQAGALPCVALTALGALQPANIQPGQRVLIHGGSGGVGSCAVQMAKAQGAHVTATCSTKNMQLVKSIGADEVVDYTQQSVDQCFKNNPFDVVVDLVGGTTTTQSLAVLKRKGHMCFVLNPNMTKGNMSQLIAGLARGSLGLGPKWHAILSKPDGHKMQEIAQLLAAGKLKAVIAKTYPLEQAAAAHEYAENGHPGGKVVIQVGA